MGLGGGLNNQLYIEPRIDNWGSHAVSPYCLPRRLFCHGDAFKCSVVGLTRDDLRIPNLQPPHSEA
jgi:hypothetical protein